MMKRPQLRYRRVVGLSLAACVLLVIAAWLTGSSIVAPANRPVGPPPERWDAVSTTLASESGSQIATWYVPVDGSEATVVLLHPIRGNRRSMLDRAELLVDAGYSVVLIDMQAHGESPGACMTIGFLERHDVRAAVEFARRQNPRHRIGVVGRSLGGAASLLGSPLAIDALVLESVYPTIEEAVHDRVRLRLGPLTHVATPLLLCQLRPRLGISPAQLRPIDHIAQAGCPVLIAGGEQDRHTTLAETQRLYEAAESPKELVVFRGAAHVDLCAFDEDLYREKVLAFFDKHLRPPTGTDSPRSTRD